MKRFLLGIGLLGVAAFLGGCPIYPSQGNEYRVCQGSGCYSCPDQSYSGACIPWQCSQDSDCDSGYVCSTQDQCIPAPPDSSDAGDCSINGCPVGYVCELANGVAECVSLSTPSGDAGVDAPTSADAAADAPAKPITCNGDGDCTAAAGSRCVDGVCTLAVGLCSDGTQCKAAGAACVEGICEARCNASTPCPAGYGCDFTLGVCDLNPGACTGSGTSTCPGGATCVEGHCVAPCSSTAEGGAACVEGQVCVNGGCIPDQAASFACSNDGDQGALANDCQPGFTCLHHSCYLACELDASASCAGAKTGSSCRDVKIETGTYAVCAPNGMLGGQCDPAQGTTCSSGVCVDGFCR
jgi:hypothetical protein